MNDGRTFHVIVFTDSFLETSGVGTYYRTLLDWCVEEPGVEMTVVCPDPAGGKDFEPTGNVIAIKPKLQSRFPLYKDITVGHYPRVSLQRIINNIVGPKVVHIASSGPLGIAAAGAAEKLNVPIVGCYHTDMVTRGKVYGRRFLGKPGEWIGKKIMHLGDRLAYGRCREIYAPSETALKAPAEFFKGSTKVITNPIDTARFSPGDSRDGWFRDRYKTDDRPLVITVGRIAREKSQDQLCELLMPDERVNLVLVGDGPNRASLEKQWNVDVTGFLQGDQLVDAYRQADVYVQVSRSETFGLCIVEALACGLPAVALRAPGITADLGPGCGVDVLEEYNLNEMAQRCVDLASDHDRYQEFESDARRFALQCGAQGVLPKWLEFHATHAQ